ncbi:MAG: exo-alpha-sialidase [Armatimonadetes bacterium]|nr:exo-alpha-sialidase [Armatimonadota bacterium]
MDSTLKLEAEHGVVSSLPEEQYGYFGWPTVARMEEGTLVVASSGLRSRHICPWGKTVLNISPDNGRTWSDPQVLTDTPLDDRDAGVICLGGKKQLVSWFTNRVCDVDASAKMYGAEAVEGWHEAVSTWTDEVTKKWLGSWIRLSEDGIAWSDPIRVPVSTPHGPIALASGDLLYLGKEDAGFDGGQDNGRIQAIKSKDGGRTWLEAGVVPNRENSINDDYWEPHIVELSSGKLIGMIRYEGEDLFFGLYQTESEDGGVTWTPAHSTGVFGSPPHLMRHTSGALVCVYGYRKQPYGERAMISRDDGASWESDYILRDDGHDIDLGYPSSCELPDGSLFTVYYQKVSPGNNPSLLWTCWRLPE